MFSLYASAWRRCAVVTADRAEMAVCDNPSRSAACQICTSSFPNNHIGVTTVAFLLSPFSNRHSVTEIICQLVLLMKRRSGNDTNTQVVLRSNVHVHGNSHEVDQPQHAHSSEVRLGVVSLESNVPPLFGDPGLQLNGRHQQLPQLRGHIL